MIEFDVKLTPKDLFTFNMKQTYSSMSGWVSIGMTALLLIMSGISFREASMSYALLYLAAAIFLAFYIPVTLRMRAKMTMKSNQVLSGTLHYQISEKEIRVTQNGEEGTLEWNYIYKMTGSEKMVLIYSSRVNAYIIPGEALENRYSKLKEIAEKKLPKHRLQMK